MSNPAAAAYEAFKVADLAFNDARIRGDVAAMDRFAEEAEAAADAYDIAYRAQLIADGGYAGLVAAL